MIPLKVWLLNRYRRRKYVVVALVAGWALLLLLGSILLVIILVVLDKADIAITMLFGSIVLWLLLLALIWRQVLRLSQLIKPHIINTLTNFGLLQVLLEPELSERVRRLDSSTGIFRWLSGPPGSGLQHRISEFIYKYDLWCKELDIQSYPSSFVSIKRAVGVAQGLSLILLIGVVCVDWALGPNAIWFGLVIGCALFVHWLLVAIMAVYNVAAVLGIVGALTEVLMNQDPDALPVHVRDEW